MSSGDESSGEEEEEFREDMRVFLRLRPMNKLEQSRRSKNCIELHEDTTVITVDSPLEGEYDFVFDHVFEEYASQEEVYEQSLVDVPRNLLQGYNCSVIAYGQTGTGKTHTMLGVNGGSEGLLFKSKSVSGSMRGGDTMSAWEDEPSEITTSIVRGSASRVPEKEDDVDPEAEGMIPRTISTLFELIRESPPELEYTIRCSFVEIYLEKILDLLNPQGTGISLSIDSNDDDQEADKAAGSFLNARIRGASELCCFDASDVCALLARGNACRTMSSTEMNTESSRSHAIFVLRVEQRNTNTGTLKESLLHMVDLAGSEHGQQRVADKRASMALQRSRSSRSLQGSSVQVEAAMINRSLSALNRMVRTQLEIQRGKDLPIENVANMSKLTRLMRPCFGGNCMTTLILTASPSSYNIGETINTIKFGQRCRKILNNPQILQTERPVVYQKKLQLAEKKHKDAMALVHALATECIALKEGTSTGSENLWETIEDVVQEKGGDANLDFTVTSRKSSDAAEGEGDEGDEGDEDDVSLASGKVESLRVANKRLRKLEDEINEMENKLIAVTRARDEAENQLSEIQSEVAVLRTQNENLTADKKRNVSELIDAKNEIQALSQRKLEVEHNLRTSQFRENEAIVFLRQFRKFYRNVLKDKAANGSGSIRAIAEEISHKVPNAPDLKDLRDIDTLMFESGLIEEQELGEDRSSATYTPTRDALLRSAVGAQRAATSEAEIALSAGTSGLESSTSGDSSYATESTVASSIKKMGTLAVNTSDLDAISEIGEGGISQYAKGQKDVDEHSNEDDSSIGKRAEESVVSKSGADAGAGSSVPGSESILSGDQSYAHSITRGPNTGMMVTRRQKLLRTPSGRLTTMREKDLEKELLETSERCIKLQTALNEEKAVVDALTNKAGGLSKKKLAQEAISLRQKLEQKNNSLTAIAWKMNELNLINKTNNEKMVNREQHVIYLEAQLLEMKHSSQKMSRERLENEKKLREEVEHLREVVDGMMVPLWQFGESHISQKPLASRIMVPLYGGDHDQDMDLPQRRMSGGEFEPEFEFDGDELREEESAEESAVGSDEEEASDDGTERYPDSVVDSVESESVMSRSVMSKSVMSRSVASRRRGSDERSYGRPKYEPEYVVASTQTDPMAEPKPKKPRTATVHVQTDAPPQKCDAEAQTDAAPVMEKEDVGIQVEPDLTEVGVQAEAEMQETGIQTEEVEEDEQEVVEPKETMESEVQTEAVNIVDPVEKENVYVQTDDVATESVYIQTDDVDMENAYAQTDDRDLEESGTQTDPVEFREVGEADDIQKLRRAVETPPPVIRRDLAARSVPPAQEPRTNMEDEMESIAGKEDSVESTSYTRDDGVESDASEDLGQPSVEKTVVKPSAGVDELGRSDATGEAVAPEITDDDIEVPEIANLTSDEDGETTVSNPIETDEDDEQDSEFVESDVDSTEESLPESREKYIEDAEEPEEPPTEDESGEPERVVLDDPIVSSRRLSPMAARFLLDDDRPSSRASTGGGSKTPAMSRFMPEDARPGKSPVSAPRRVLLNNDQQPPAADKKRESIDMSSVMDGNLDDVEDYDNLGKKWGMSASDIAADSAFLSTPRVNTPGLLGSQDEDDNDEEEDEAEEDPLPSEPLDQGSLYSEDEDEENFLGREKDNGPKKRGASSDFNLYSDDENEEHARSATSIDDDDFDRMMDETAAALAAADELLPSEDEDAHDEDEDLLDDTGDDDGDDYHIADDNDGATEESYVTESTERTKNMVSSKSLTSEMLMGGRSKSFEPRRFVAKLGPLMKPCVVKGASHRRAFYPEEESVQSGELGGGGTITSPQSSKRKVRQGRSQSRPRDDKKKKKKKHKEPENMESSTAKDKKKKKKKKSAPEPKKKRSGSKMRN